MKRVKIISCDQPELIGKTALMRLPNTGNIWLNGEKVKLNNLKVDILKPASEKDCTYIVFQQMTDTFFVVNFVETAKYLCMDARPKLMDGTILKRLRDLRAEGKVNYRSIGQTGNYRKLPLKERAIQEIIHYDFTDKKSIEFNEDGSISTVKETIKYE